MVCRKRWKMPQDEKQTIRELKDKLHDQELALKGLELVVGKAHILATNALEDIRIGSPIAVCAAEEICHTIVRVTENYK